MGAAGLGSGTPSSTASLGKFRVLLGWESPAWPLRFPCPIAQRGGRLPAARILPSTGGSEAGADNPATG